MAIHRVIQEVLSSDRGAIAPTLAVSLIALIGIGALAVDISRMFALHTELQSAADAAALAGATQLDQEDGARARAVAAAISAGPIQNRQILSTDALGGAVVITAANITFLQDLTTRAEATSDADANFIQVNPTGRDVAYILGPIVGQFGREDLTAHAVAGYGSALCKVPPLMMCQIPGIDLTNADALKGRGIVMRSKSGGGNSQWTAGNFGFLAPDAASLGANELRDALGRINPRAACIGTSVTTEPGQNDAVRTGFNTRFDIYHGNAGSLNTDAQYRPARNVIKGMVRNGNQCGTGGQGWRAPNNAYTGDNDSNGADAMSLPRDRCAYSGYVQGAGDPAPCVPSSGGRVGNGDWPINAYFQVVHGTNNWRAAMGLTATDPRPTRYEVYSWELEQIDSNPSFVTTRATYATGERPAPVCASPTPVDQVEPDRRTISAVVMDCTGKSGRFSGEPLANVDLFILEPMVDVSNDRMIYAEIIGQTSAGSVVGQETLYHVVQLYE